MLGGVVALLGVGVVGVKAITSDEATGGAASPEAAMLAMLDALSDEDPLAVLAVLDPAEVDVIGDGVKELRDAFTGADSDSGVGQIVEDSDVGRLDPNDLAPGFEIVFSDVAVTAVPLGSNFARVNLDSLTADWTFDADQFESALDSSELSDEVGASADDEFGSFDAQDIADELYSYDSGITSPFFVTKQVGGRWYVSLVLTALETARLDGGISDEPEWGDLGSASDFGEESPAAAVEAMVDAVIDADLNDVVELLPPGRYDSLYRFRRVFGSDSGSNIEASISVAPNEVVRSDRGTLLPLSGSSISVTARSDYDSSYETFTVNFYDDCVAVFVESYDEYWGETNYDDFELCLEDDLRELGDVLDEAGIDSSWIDDIQFDDGFTINVEQVGGKWFVDPIATVDAYITVFSDAAAG